MAAALERCPDCGAPLPAVDGPTHRYIGASAACWALFSALNNAGEPPLAPAPHLALLPDAYAAQHPGVPSPQAIQSVAVHLITLHGVFVRGVTMSQAVWLRQAALVGRDKHARFTWLTPPDLTRGLTVADIVAGATPESRTDLARQYITDVWQAWAAHHATVATWYAHYVHAG